MSCLATHVKQAEFLFEKDTHRPSSLLLLLIVKCKKSINVSYTVNLHKKTVANKKCSPWAALSKKDIQ